MNILLVGATGQMGRAVSDLAGSEIVAGIGRSASDFPVYETFKEVTEDVDVIIDFSTPDLLEDMLNFAEKNKVPVV
ncbi:MAG TPA: 4-hydroxy-tetrahydrodipicolinate reductase, partial [Jeotgalicoccus sp.]|nr:4-hydroxy-tetrahydrodipicolinate reductase [Jeotgalicoccus sp.]